MAVGEISAEAIPVKFRPEMAVFMDTNAPEKLGNVVCLRLVVVFREEVE